MSHISGLIGKLFYYYPDKLVNKLGVLSEPDKGQN